MYIIDTIDYRDYTIQIRVDAYPGNPWEEWDCEPPLAVMSFGYHNSEISTYGNQDVIRDVLNYWTPEQLHTKRDDVLLALGATRDDLAAFLWDNRGHYVPGHAIIQLVEDFVVDWLADYPYDAGTYLETVADLYRCAGIPAGCNQHTATAKVTTPRCWWP